MAVREFNYEEAKSTMNKIQDQAKNVQNYLNRCEDIMQENVGVEGRWSGDRATAFKQKWQKTSAEFKNFVDVINQYAAKIDESYQAHKKFEQRG